MTVHRLIKKAETVRVGNEAGEQEIIPQLR